jgi:RNA polymerase sigma factor (sigma-70 family)
VAKYTPDNWRCSANANRILTERYTQIAEQVRTISSNFRMNYPDQCDFQQEGMLAALYAIDSYTPSRGKLEAYIQTVVYNAMAMVACEAAALRRAPKCIDADGRRVSALTPLDPDTVPCNDNEEPHAFRRETDLAKLQKRVAGRRRIEALKQTLSHEARLVLEMKLNPPMELHVMARNLHGRNKLTNNALSKYTGITISRVEKSLREIRDAARKAGLVSAEA